MSGTCHRPVGPTWRVPEYKGVLSEVLRGEDKITKLLATAIVTSLSALDISSGNSIGLASSFQVNGLDNECCTGTGANMMAARVGSSGRVPPSVIAS